MTASESLPQPPSWPLSDDAIQDVFSSMFADGSWGRYHGPHCDRLRCGLAEYFSVEHVVLCSSGTSAVELALRAAQVGQGDEVIMAAYDYKANFANVLIVGATPVLIDTLPGVPVPDVDQMAAAISGKTKAVICSHLHGSFAPVEQIKTVAKNHGIIVIEDACQSIGGRIEPDPVGAIGDLGVLSFGGSKLMTAGRGGAVLTDDATLAQRIRLYTQRGNDAYPLSEMQAAVLAPQLQHLDNHTLARLNAAQRLLDMLGEDTCLRPAVSPDPFEMEEYTSAFYKLAFCYDNNASGGDSREDFTAAMRQNGIALDPAFPALHLIHGKRRFRAVGNLANATALHEKLVTLHHPVLMGSLQALQHIADSIRRYRTSQG